MPDTGQTREYLFEGYRLQTPGKRLFNPDGEPLPLSHRALDTLIVLIENRGRILSKATLMDKVWADTFVEENNLNQAITSIRKALGDSKQEGRFIKTFKGKGYSFVAAVERVAGNEAPVAPQAGEDPVPAPAAGVDAGRQPLVTPAFALVALAVLAVAVSLWQFGGPDAGVNENAAATDGTSLPAAGDNAPAIPDSIAVLPLTTLNPDNDNKVFALGMHMELINRLSRVKDLKLISHNGVPASMVQERPLTELGRLLKVEYIITGSILLLDDNARINLYLLEADTGIIVWTDNYAVDTDNLTGSIPSQIALDIAGAMDVSVSENDRIAVQARPTDSFEAYRYQLASVSAFSAMDYAKAWTLSKQALELDPDYLDAVHMFSRVNSVLSATPLPGMTGDDHIRLSLEAAETSIELAPDKPRGYIFKAVALSSSNQWHAAMAEVERLLAMNVSPATLQFLAPIMMAVGRFDEAVNILEANLREEPINLHARGFLLAAHEMAGNRMQSRMEYELGEELNPEWWGDTVNIFLAMGRQEPVRDIQNIQDISDALKGHLEKINEGDTAYISRALDAYDPEQRADTVELVYYSAIAAYIGKNDQAIEFMRAAVEDVGLNIHWSWLPVYDRMRRQEAFRVLLEDAGLADYWREHGWPEYCRPVDDSFTCDTGPYDLISMQ